MEAADPVVVDGYGAEAELAPRIYVHAGERRGFFVPVDSGDDLYLYWVETTDPAPGGVLPCEQARPLFHLPAGACAPTELSNRPPEGVRVRHRRDGPTAEMVGLGRGTEQWIWQFVPAWLSDSPPVLPGWGVAAAAGGVGVPLFLPEPVLPGPPMIIGHRGSPGRLPDHTLAGYTLAIEQGADAIEPDLVATKDGVLVCRHENELSQTTDVAARFPERRRSATIDGLTVEGWFTEDLTLAELRTLRARQPWPDRPHDHDGEFPIPTFDEVLELAATRGVAIVPEVKHPSYFRALGLPLEERLEEALRRHPGVSVVIQSFELENLARFSGRRRLFLVGAPDQVIPGDSRTYGQVLGDLPALRERAEAIGVSREMVWGPAGPTGLVERAHAAGLQVFVWTLRAERPGPAWNGDLVAEIRAYFALGVDAIFADQPDLAVKAR